jgi:hypothetical protein
MSRNRHLRIQLYSYCFVAEAFVKWPLLKDNVCGRIFLTAAELSCKIGRKILPRVGNTAQGKDAIFI